MGGQSRTIFYWTKEVQKDWAKSWGAYLEPFPRKSYLFKIVKGTAVSTSHGVVVAYSSSPKPSKATVPRCIGINGFWPPSDVWWAVIIAPGSSARFPAHWWYWGSRGWSWSWSWYRPSWGGCGEWCWSCIRHRCWSWRTTCWSVRNRWWRWDKVELLFQKLLSPSCIPPLGRRADPLLIHSGFRIDPLGVQGEGKRGVGELEIEGLALVGQCLAESQTLGYQGGVHFSSHFHLFFWIKKIVERPKSMSSISSPISYNVFLKSVTYWLTLANSGEAQLKKPPCNINTETRKYQISLTVFSVHFSD